MKSETWTLGDWRVDAFVAGQFALDGRAMFGSVPRALWEKRIAPDTLHRIPLLARLLLLRRNTGEVVLVDTGMGNRFDARFAEMFAITPGPDRPASFVEPLQELGVGIDDITHVLLTHLHFDHSGGISIRRGESVEPVFASATHWVQRENFETAERPNAKEKASYLPENVQPLRETSLVLLDGPEELLPGLSVTPSHGHTRGMQTVRVAGGGKVLYYLADLAPTHHHLHLPFTMGYDINALDVMAEKEALLSRSVEEEAVVVFEHDSQVGSGRVQRERGRYSLIPTEA